MEAGKWAEAQAAFAAYTGTIHSVCSQVIADFCIEAGLSPRLQILDQDRAEAVFATATEQAIDRFIEQAEEIIYRFGWSTWRKDVHRICQLARENNLNPDRSGQCATFLVIAETASPGTT